MFEAFGVGHEGRVESDRALAGQLGGVAKVHAFRGHETNPGMPMDRVVPGEEGLTVSPRICFRWSGSDAEDVEIVDYH